MFYAEYIVGVGRISKYYKIASFIILNIDERSNFNLYWGLSKPK